MKVSELAIGGAWLFEPNVFPDARGMFIAPFQGELFAGELGFQLEVRQTNVSSSSRGVVRGVHFADTPPGQSKYVHCVHGSILDIIVDVREGSPTFGRHVAVELDASTMKAVYLAEGLGHAFMAMEDDTVVAYLCSTPYNPGAEHGVNPFDVDLALSWPSDIEPVMSPKDSAAPSLAGAREAGLLPQFEKCETWYEALRS